MGGGHNRYGGSIGLGARISGTFVLQEGEVIKMMVGQMPANEDLNNNRGGGGGGGTFVLKPPHSSISYKVKR